MVRRCAVAECTESDQTLLSHRFPKLPDVARKWQRALDIQHHSIDDLQKKFVVCTKHFSPSAYRNSISNSLNSTSMPNLNDNSDNERISTTNQSSKKQLSAPVRCHKLPPQSQIQIVIQHPAKKLKLAESDINLISLVDEPVEAPETFEILEYSPDDGVESQDEQTDLASLSPEPETTEMPSAALNKPRTSEASTMTTELSPQISLSSVASQTDPEPKIEPPKPIPPPQESKDDKMLSILYPELKAKSKIELAEIISEKCQRIESLEDKVKKLELAMRNLL